MPRLQAKLITKEEALKRYKKGEYTLNLYEHNLVIHARANEACGWKISAEEFAQADQEMLDALLNDTNSTNVC